MGPAVNYAFRPRRRRCRCFLAPAIGANHAPPHLDRHRLVLFAVAPRRLKRGLRPAYSQNSTETHTTASSKELRANFCRAAAAADSTDVPDAACLPTLQKYIAPESAALAQPHLHDPSRAVRRRLPRPPELWRRERQCFSGVHSCPLSIARTLFGEGISTAVSRVGHAVATINRRATRTCLICRDERYRALRSLQRPAAAWSLIASSIIRPPRPFGEQSATRPVAEKLSGLRPHTAARQRQARAELWTGIVERLSSGQQTLTRYRSVADELQLTTWRIVSPAT